MNDQPAIEVRGLSKRYGETVAAQDVTFSISRGEIFGLLGPNGAGKTTTLECLLGLRQPDAGSIRILGLEHARHGRAIRRQLGVQLQTTGLLPQLTVREQVALFARLSPQPLPIEQSLNLVGLTEQARVKTKDLSGGQKQRLAVALALVSDPHVVFLDEPTTGLDPQARHQLWDVILDLRLSGRTVLLTTHYMEEAQQLCDRVAILDHGCIIAMDTPQALIARYFKATAIEFGAPSWMEREVLAALPGVQQSLLENGRVTLYSTAVPQTIASLLALAAERQDGFSDMAVRQATLEDVFLKLTGRRIR
jgi:ABC-2 type transport system ATP-binding protein